MLALAALTSTLAVSLPASYRVVDLGSLGSDALAFAINNSGHVVGRADLTHDPIIIHGFLYDGVMHDLGTLGGTHCEAMDINDQGQIVGNSSPADGQFGGAFLYSNGSMVNLGTLGGSYSGAEGINNLGQIVGSSQITGNTARHAFLYSNGIMTDLGTLGGVNSRAHDINSVGVVVGYSNFIEGNYSLPHAFVYTSEGGMRDINGPGSERSWAHAINDAGHVVGQMGVPNFDTHAFLWDGISMIDLGTLGGPYGEASDINSAGLIVGSSTPGTYTFDYPHAFIHDGIRMRDLNPMIDSSGNNSLVFGASGVNDQGWICGSALMPGGASWHAVLLIPQSVELVHPSNYVLRRGKRIVGGLHSLHNSDSDQDSPHLILGPGPVFSGADFPVIIEITGQVPFSNPSALRFGVESSANIEHVGQTIELFDYIGQKWVQVDFREILRYQDTTSLMTVPNHARFIAEGTREVKARMKYKPTQPVLASYEVRID